MATQASLDITTGDTSSAAWADSVVAHTITTETATPATVFEGKMWARTDVDRMTVRDGGGVDQTVFHYSTAGRIWFEATFSASIGASTTAQLNWTVVADPTSSYFGWTGTAYEWRPASGLWCFGVDWYPSSPPSSACRLQMALTRNASGVIHRFNAQCPNGFGEGLTLSPNVPLEPSDRLSFNLLNNHSGSLTWTGRLWAFRVGV